MTRNLINCENTISLNLDWRLQISFFRNLTEIMVFLPVNHLKTCFIPLLINRIVTSVRIYYKNNFYNNICFDFRDQFQCASSLPDVCYVCFAIFLFFSKISIFSSGFVTTLCYGKSCSQRMLFLNVCQLISELCDKKAIN